MAKLDFTTLSRPVAVTETKGFTDYLQPGTVLELKFSARPDYGLQMLAAEKGMEFARTWALGVAKNPAPFPLGDDVVTISKSLCLAIGSLMVLQRENIYSFNEWVGISVYMPNAFPEICAWADSLMARANGETLPEDDDGKNDSAGQGESS